MITYTDCKLVRFPIEGDKVPDKLWLGRPLFKANTDHLKMCSNKMQQNCDSFYVHFQIANITYRAETKPSGVQVIILQLQGSTELMSQLSRTLYGSRRLLFMATKATTAPISTEKWEVISTKNFIITLHFWSKNCPIKYWVKNLAQGFWSQTLFK